MVTLKGLLGRLVALPKNPNGHASKVAVKLPLSPERVMKVRAAFDKAESIFATVRQSLRQGTTAVAAATPMFFTQMQQYIETVETFARALKHQRETWEGAMRNQEDRKFMLLNWPVTPLSSSTKPVKGSHFKVNNRETSLALSVRKTLSEIGTFTASYKKQIHALAGRNNVPLRVKYGTHAPVANTPRRHLNSPLAPSTPNVAPKKGNRNSRVHKTIALTVPLLAQEKTLVQTRFTDARHLIKTALLNMAQNAKLVAKHGTKNDVARHNELLDLVHQYDRELKKQRAAWKPYLTPRNNSVARKKVTLPNWPATPLSSAMVKNPKYNVNARELGLAKNVRQTLSNTGQAVNAVVRKLSPNFVWIARPLKQSHVQRARAAFEQLFDHIVLVAVQIDRIFASENGRYVMSLPKWEQSQLHRDSQTLEHIHKHLIKQLVQWSPLLAPIINNKNARKVWVEMPNWPVTPLSEMNVLNGKNPIPAAAPDVQLTLHALKQLMKHHPYVTAYNYSTLPIHNGVDQKARLQWFAGENKRLRLDVDSLARR